MNVAKWTQEPPLRLTSDAARTEEEVEVFHDDPLLTSKGVQLVLVFTENRGHQLRHRLVDEARSQLIALFHVEDDHRDPQNGLREPHIHVGHGRGAEPRDQWDVDPLINFEESKDAVFSRLNIQQRPSGLDKWP
jgi:hypothetical protein